MQVNVSYCYNAEDFYNEDQQLLQKLKGYMVSSLLPRWSVAYSLTSAKKGFHVYSSTIYRNITDEFTLSLACSLMIKDALHTQIYVNKQLYWSRINTGFKSWVKTQLMWHCDHCSSLLDSNQLYHLFKWMYKMLMVNRRQLGKQITTTAYVVCCLLFKVGKKQDWHRINKLCLAFLCNNGPWLGS